jgi:ABC-2 type transport system permease protein
VQPTMSVSRAWQVLRKDLRLGPRSPLLLWALVVPVVITVLVRGVFGGLFESDVRVGIVDQAGSVLAGDLAARDGLAVERLDDAEALRAQVADGGLDGGLVLRPGFDDAVRAGERPALELWLSAHSQAADRAVLTATVLDAVRSLSGASSPTTVEVVELGEPGLPLDLLLLPLIVMYAVAIPGGMVPAASLVEEKERGTIQALLASPASIGEVLAAKGALGVLLGVVAGTVTLALNDAFGAAPVAVLAAVVVGAVMMAEIGLMLGCWARDTNTLFAAWKGGGIILFLPAVFFIWPGLPTWPAYFMPAYYFLRPAYAVAVEGARLGDVAGLLAIGAALCLALVPAVVATGRWLEVRMATGRIQPASTPELVDA